MLSKFIESHWLITSVCNWDSKKRKSTRHAHDFVITCKPSPIFSAVTIISVSIHDGFNNLCDDGLLVLSFISAFPNASTNFCSYSYCIFYFWVIKWIYYLLFPSFLLLHFASFCWRFIILVFCTIPLMDVFEDVLHWPFHVAGREETLPLYDIVHPGPSHFYMKTLSTVYKRTKSLVGRAIVSNWVTWLFSSVVDSFCPFLPRVGSFIVV